VSVLSSLSKILERVVHKQLNGYLESKNILFDFQSGFRSGYSTDTCLAHLTDYVRAEISKGSLVGMVMIDLRKAFDTVDFEILLTKLKAMGVKSTDWFRSYLTNRTQCVNVNGVDSDFLEVPCGVPQGSILGPLLFLCYVNDMSISLKCKLSLYADDSTLVASSSSVDHLSSFLSGQLESCSKWLIDNKLSLHAGKCESIIFSSSRKSKQREKFVVKLFGQEVKRVCSVKYLGVTLDENLSGNEHGKTVLKKASSRLSFLYRQSGLLDSKSRATLCMALIQPYLDYCCSSWFSSLGSQFKNRLDALQRKMARFVLNLDSRSSISLSDLCKLGWLAVGDRVRYFKLILAFKIRRGQAPAYLVDSFPFSSSIHSYNTRRSQTDYFVSKEDTVSSIMLNSFVYTTKHEWNALPYGIKDISKLDLFKRKLREHLFRRY